MNTATCLPRSPTSTNPSAGNVQRHTSLRWEELKASAAGGRWGASRAFEVLYLGRPPDSVVIEAYRHLVDESSRTQALAATVLERRMVTCKVDIPNILDFVRPPLRLRSALRRPAVLRVGDHEPVKPSARPPTSSGSPASSHPPRPGLGETLALFPTNLPIEHWPEMIARDIWRGLPADPRRLRLVDETG